MIGRVDKWITTSSWLKNATGILMAIVVVSMLGWALYDTVTRPPAPEPLPPRATPMPQLSIVERETESLICAIVRMSSEITSVQCLPKKE